MRTKSHLLIVLFLTALVCTLFLSGCKTASVKPSIEPTVSEVRCKQRESRPIPPAPAADEWVTYYPALPPAVAGMAVLSERAAIWVIEVLGVAEERKALRDVEHACLDEAERKGLILQ